MLWVSPHQSVAVVEGGQWGDQSSSPPTPSTQRAAGLEMRGAGAGGGGEGGQDTPSSAHTGASTPLSSPGWSRGGRGCSCSPEEEVVGAVVPAHCLAAAGQAEILVAIPTADHQHLGFGEGERRGTGA